MAQRPSSKPTGLKCFLNYHIFWITTTNYSSSCSLLSHLRLPSLQTPSNIGIRWLTFGTRRVSLQTILRPHLEFLANLRETIWPPWNWNTFLTLRKDSEWTGGNWNSWSWANTNQLTEQQRSISKKYDFFLNKLFIYFSWQLISF